MWNEQLLPRGEKDLPPGAAAGNSIPHFPFPIYQQKRYPSGIPLIARGVNRQRACLRLRKNPPATQISAATPATMAEPTSPDTVVPAGLSLSGKA